MTNFGYIKPVTGVAPEITALIDELTALSNNVATDAAAAEADATAADALVASALADIAQAEADTLTAQADVDQGTIDAAAAVADVANVVTVTGNGITALGTTESDAVTALADANTLVSDVAAADSTANTALTDSATVADAAIVVDASTTITGASATALLTDATRVLGYSFGYATGQTIAKPSGVNTFAENINMTPLLGTLTQVGTTTFTLETNKVYRITLVLNADVSSGFYMRTMIRSLTPATIHETNIFIDGFYDDQGRFRNNTVETIYDTTGRTGSALQVLFQISVDFGTAAANAVVNTDTWYLIKEIYH